VRIPKNFQCDLCLTKFFTAVDLRQHQDEVHTSSLVIQSTFSLAEQENNRKLQTSSYQCNLCPELKFSTKHGLITHRDSHSHTGPKQWTGPEPASEKRVKLATVFSQEKPPMTKERTSLTITPVVGKKEQVIRPDENERVPNAESDATTYVFVCLGCRVIMTDLLEVLEHMKTRCMINVKRVESVTQAQEILNRL